jgi:hypothetical protein
LGPAAFEFSDSNASSVTGRETRSGDECVQKVTPLAMTVQFA